MRDAGEPGNPKKVAELSSSEKGDGRLETPRQCPLHVPPI